MLTADLNSVLNGETKGNDSQAKSNLSILGKKASAAPKQSNHFKKPEGMHRELYNLLKASDAIEMNSLMPAQIKKSAKPKVQLGLKAVRKFKWTPFINEARKDGLQLYHWRRTDIIEKGEPYPFSKFNKVLNIPSFSALSTDEYDKHLKTSKWSREETEYLFEMCKQFDCRWVIVHDRYDASKFGSSRSIEDMKERFYAVVHELGVMKDSSTPAICYDAEHERRRKEQLNKQWNRTKEERDEEEELTRELKNIEARKKERERKAQDLQKLISMAEMPCSPASGGMSPAISKKRDKFRLKAGSNATSTTTFNFNPVDISVAAIRYSEFKSAGAHLRSQEMKLPQSVGQKKLKTIETVLKECQMEMIPMGSEAIVTEYNEFRSQIMLLQELKATLQNAEFELESLKTRLQESGKTIEIEPRFRISLLSEGGLAKSQVGSSEGAPSSDRRITSYIDVSNAMNPQVGRKRKNPINLGTPLQMDPKRMKRT